MAKTREMRTKMKTFIEAICACRSSTAEVSDETCAVNGLDEFREGKFVHLKRRIKKPTSTTKAFFGFKLPFQPKAQRGYLDRAVVIETLVLSARMFIFSLHVHAIRVSFICCQVETGFTGDNGEPGHGITQPNLHCLSAQCAKVSLTFLAMLSRV